jgi:DNA-binding XRE family transcriptional regulator
VLIEFKEIDQETLNKAEMFYIDLFESMENGFNQTIGGDGVQGREKTKEEIEKIRQTKLNGFINNVYSRTTGETNGMNILSEKDVIEIVSYFYKMEKSDTELAKMYGVGRQTINTIHNGKRWSYLQEVKDWLKFKEENNHKFRRQGSNTLFPIEIYEIKHLLKAGFDKKEISQLYNTSTTTVHRIMKNQAYTDIDTSKPYSYYKL